MSNRRIAALHTSHAGEEPLPRSSVSPREAAQLLALALALSRWHRILEACDGDVEQAQLVLLAVEQAELAELRRLARRIGRPMPL